MLVLSRRKEETLEFPGLGIKIQVLKCSSQQVRIGIEAPKEIAVLRGELSEHASVPPAANGVAGSPSRRAADGGSRKRSTPSDSGSVPSFSPNLVSDLRSLVHDAAAKLNQLHALEEESAWGARESHVLGLFGQLKELDRRVAQLDPAKPTDATPIRALIVDDNDNESRLLSSYLKVKGLQVTTACDGQAAITCLSEQTPDVVLLDMTMPEFDGRWTIDRIRADSQMGDIKVFAVSGTDEANSDVKVGPSGVNGWFRKPVDPDHLIAEIGKSFPTTSRSAAPLSVTT